MADKVLVHRAMALGDVLLATPIIRELAQQGYDVDVSSNYPFVFKGNPYIKQSLLPSQVSASDYEDIYNLDMVYENNPKQHIIKFGNFSNCKLPFTALRVTFRVADASK